MEHSRTQSLVRAAVAAAREASVPLGAESGSIPVHHYTDPARLERERRVLFAGLPIPIAASREIPTAGAIVVRGHASISLILVRGKDGVARGFKNACRHRATRLVREDGCAKAFVCPYHGWTYDLGGALMHIPHEKAFPDLDRATHGLVEVRVEERAGLVFAALDASAPTASAHLGALEEEIDALSLDTHFVGRRVVREQRGNWKMLMEAFLEGYHIRTLHRDTIYPFFLDARSAAERVGPHVRHASARRAARDDPDDAASTARSLREIATFAYVLFPCTVLIAHPDWTSHVVVQPITPDRFVWSHTQLIPSVPPTDEARAHFERSFSLIEETVFEREDLFAIAEMQAGLETGANEVLTFGLLETPALWLHDAIRSALGD